MRVIVTGSRHHTDELLIRSTLLLATVISRSDVTIIHGGARGADRLADDIARRHGWAIEVYPADWDTYGKRAGFIRNIEMAKSGADICMAYPLGESRGTRHMIQTAEKYKIPVKIFEES